MKNLLNSKKKIKILNDPYLTNLQFYYWSFSRYSLKYIYIIFYEKEYKSNEQTEFFKNHY